MGIDYNLLRPGILQAAVDFNKAVIAQTHITIETSERKTAIYKPATAEQTERKLTLLSLPRELLDLILGHANQNVLCTVMLAHRALLEPAASLIQQARCRSQPAHQQVLQLKRSSLHYY